MEIRYNLIVLKKINLLFLTKIDVCLREDLRVLRCSAAGSIFGRSWIISHRRVRLMCRCGICVVKVVCGDRIECDRVRQDECSVSYHSKWCLREDFCVLNVHIPLILL